MCVPCESQSLGTFLCTFLFFFFSAFPGLGSPARNFFYVRSFYVFARNFTGFCAFPEELFFLRSSDGSKPRNFFYVRSFSFFPTFPELDAPAENFFMCIPFAISQLFLDSLL